MRTQWEWTAAAVCGLATAAVWATQTTAPATSITPITIPACCVHNDPAEWTPDRVTALQEQPATTVAAEPQDANSTR